MDFHKDEVRALGESLGLPKELVNRHPFPGMEFFCRVSTLFFSFFVKAQGWLSV